MNNNEHPDAVSRRVRNLRLLRFGVIPGAACIVTAILIMVVLNSNPAVPSSGPVEDTAQPALTTFTDDLGAETTLTFTTVEMTQTDLSEGSLVLVNGDTPWYFPAEIPLSNVYDNAADAYQLSGTGLQLQQPALDALNDMMTEFVRITGFRDVMVSECYRSAENQMEVYKQALAFYGDAVSAYAAESGHSEYHTGLAVGFSLYQDDMVTHFTGTDDCAWLLRNCYRFGYVLRYQENKSDITGYAPLSHHFRYVGKPHAYLMRLKQYCLEEYLEYIAHYTFEGRHIQITDNENRKYEIYYVPAEGSVTHVPVPVSQDYEISGDNRGGFIVTVSL